MSRDCNQVYLTTKRNAARRNVSFSLDQFEFHQFWNNTNKCYYCGISEKLYKKLIRRIIACESGKNDKVDAIRWAIYIRGSGFQKVVVNFTVDRVNSFKGYLKENVVKSCWLCNFFKGRYIHGKLYKKIAKKMMLGIWKTIKKQYEKEHVEKCNFDK